MKIELEGYSTIEKTVRIAGTTGRVYLPRAWIGKRVQVTLLEPLEK